ncbi:MAG: preprotein translocase subunit YajC, partial [Sedimentisphaerales bacterium]|nr:preprotein translocase subunit YajC [Sedimentisphaerales bacterium]
MMDTIWILAQANGDAPTGIPSSPVTTEGESITTQPDPGSTEQPQTDQPRPNPYMQFLPFILLFVVMYFILFRGPRKKQQQHKQMMQELAKSDKVQTIGGIIGTVVD